MGPSDTGVCLNKLCSRYQDLWLNDNKLCLLLSTLFQVIIHVQHVGGIPKRADHPNIVIHCNPKLLCPQSHHFDHKHLTTPFMRQPQLCLVALLNKPLDLEQFIGKLSFLLERTLQNIYQVSFI